MVVKPRWYSHGLNRLAYYRLARAAAAGLPRPVRLAVARAVARGVGRALPAERRRVRANLERVLVGAPPRELDAAVDDTFANFGAFFADLLILNRADPVRLRRYVAQRAGDEHLDAAFAAGHGAVLVTAHLGNWELGGRLLACRGGAPRTHVVLSAEEDAAVERHLRVNAPELRFVTRRHPAATLGLLSALRRGEAVAVQGDRPTGERGDRLVPLLRLNRRVPPRPFRARPGRGRARSARLLHHGARRSLSRRCRRADLGQAGRGDGGPRGHGGRPRGRGARASDAVVQLLRCVGASR